MDVMLWCPRCDRDTKHLVNPWNISNDMGPKFGALSCMCYECSDEVGRLELFILGEGKEVKV